VKTPAGLAPAVFASRVSAACGSHTAAFWFGWFENSGIVASQALTHDHRSLQLELGLLSEPLPATLICPWLSGQRAPAITDR
jgi:hypothetical protein